MNLETDYSCLFGNESTFFVLQIKKKYAERMEEADVLLKQNNQKKTDVNTDICFFKLTFPEIWWSYA